MSYRTGTVVNLPFAEALAATRSALADQGFGVITEIDMQATMKAKVDADLDPYVILGACNPQLAIRALRAEPSIGTLLPCNVVVRATGDGQTVVEAVDPATMVTLTQNDQLAAVTAEVADRLAAVLESVGTGAD